MKTAGLILLVTGLVMTLYTGFTYITREKVVDLGPIQVTRDDEHSVNWQPYAGVAVMVVGGVMYMMSRKSSASA
jgi:hypothetical protein